MAAERKAQDDERHRRQYEAIPAKEEQADKRAHDTGQRRTVVVGLLPLAHQHDHKEGGHHKFNAGGVKMDHIAQQAAQGGPGDPIEMIQQGDKKHKPAPIHPFRGG